MSADQSPFVPLAERPVSRFDPASEDASPGRRLRVFAALVWKNLDAFAFAATDQLWLPDVPAATMTYGTLLQALDAGECPAGARELFSSLPLRIGPAGRLISKVPAEAPDARDPELHTALQDLANEINEDIRDALDALDDPHAYYPGVDDGIEPVTDEHVSLVIWALQRELKRELRSRSFPSSTSTLPAAPLSELPWNVQRALVERRRLRFKQWGIGKAEWERGEWSLWRTPLDPDYVPRRALRLAAEKRGGA